MSTVGIWSGKNVLKHAFMVPDTMDKPGTSDGGLGFFSSKLVTHGLGYVPIVRAYYDPAGSGSIYPTIGQWSGITGGESGDSPFANRAPIIVPFWFFIDDITTTTVTFRTFHSSSLSGTFPFYYRIYRDEEV